MHTGILLLLCSTSCRHLPACFFSEFFMWLFYYSCSNWDSDWKLQCNVFFSFYLGKILKEDAQNILFLKSNLHLEQFLLQHPEQCDCWKLLIVWWKWFNESASFSLITGTRFLCCLWLFFMIFMLFMSTQVHLTCLHKAHSVPQRDDLWKVTVKGLWVQAAFIQTIVYNELRQLCHFPIYFIQFYVNCKT